MKKNTFGRQFKRDFNERKALFKGLMTELVVRERIQTTEQKAKAIRGSVEKLVTKAKKKGQASESLLLPYLHEVAVKKMIAEIAPRFSTRPGGYTRIIKLGRRFQDNAPTAIIEWVELGTAAKRAIEKQPAGKQKTVAAGKEDAVEAIAEIQEATAKQQSPFKKIGETVKKASKLGGKGTKEVRVDKKRSNASTQKKG